MHASHSSEFHEPFAGVTANLPALTPQQSMHFVATLHTVMLVVESFDLWDEDLVMKMPC